MTDIEIYKELVLDYEFMFDNDYESSFGLKTKASNLKTRFDELVAEYNKMYLLLERQAKGEDARISHVLCKSGMAKSVADGDRQASFSPEAAKVWEQAFDAKRVRDTYKGYADHLERIYYDAKEVWSSGRRLYRENREG